MCLSIQVNFPELVLGTGEHLGFEFVITHNTLGFRCGYVRVPPGHPWHGKQYGQIEADVHGGLTFSNPDEPCAKGGADDAWWVGFDCAHCGDASDPALPATYRMRLHPWDTVRTQEYVEDQCRNLCEQAASVVANP